MKITDIESVVLRMPEVHDVADSTQDAFIVRVHTDEGIVGIGEVDCSPTIANAILKAPTSHSISKGFRELLIGEDPFEITKIWNKLFKGSVFYGRRGPAIMLMSGIDIALWDIVGKATGQPVYKLLGGAFRKEIPVYASELMPDSPEETFDLAQEVRAKGYTALKLGWGSIGQSMTNDVARVKMARKGLGDDSRLMVDAGLVWDASTAIHIARRLQEFDLFFLEDPLWPEDYTGYAELSQKANVRIAAGEEETTRYGFRDLIERGKVHVVQPDVTRCGGLSEAKNIAFLADMHGRLCIPHVWSTGIIVAASLHFVASISNGLMCEFSIRDNPLNKYLLTEPFVPKDGVLSVPEKPGLGIELNEDVIKRYQVK